MQHKHHVQFAAPPGSLKQLKSDTAKSSDLGGCGAMAAASQRA
jgi:hypothetical protein